MLDQNDIKQIGTLLQGTEDKLKEFVRENNKELTKEIVLQVGEFITDRVLPQIDELSLGLATVKDDLAEVKKTVTTLATKDDVTRVVAEVKGELVALVRKEDEKVNLHIQFSRDNKTLTEEQGKALRALHVFPSVGV